MVSPQELLQFWYSEPMCKLWFRATDAIDKHMRDQYETLWQQAAEGELDQWADTAEGCLALIILLDQFPLNMYRGDKLSFSTESAAVHWSLHAIDRGYDLQLPQERLSFLYMPLMHSENLAHQELAVEKFEQARLESNLRFARHHRELIRRFGRFPHRNAILGRESTPDELAYLSSDEAFKG